MFSLHKIIALPGQLVGAAADRSKRQSRIPPSVVSQRERPRRRLNSKVREPPKQLLQHNPRLQPRGRSPRQ